MNSTLAPNSTLPAKFFAMLGEPFSLWTKSHGQWEPTELASPTHLRLGKTLTHVPAVRGPYVEPLESGELMLCILLPSKHDTLALTAIFQSARDNPEQGWTVASLQRAATLAASREQLEHRRVVLEEEVGVVAKDLAASYEEISLLHGLTRRLRLSNTQRDLSEMAMDWLQDCLPAESIFLHYEPHVVPSQDMIGNHAQQVDPVHLVSGACCLTLEQRRAFVRDLSPIEEYVRGESTVGRQSFKHLRQYLAVAINERDHFGWLVAINHNDNQSFSSIESSLLRSVSTILGVHFANRERFEEQANLVADIVRALATSLDAKDPYTRGHSDRVANIAVALAKQMGMDEEDVRTIYIGGLLHDVGKIGVDDRVLRKEERLTADEFEQIKQHPTLGYQILADLEPLQKVLPIVRHHHERWDGSGYPDGIAGEAIELTARITAVADAFDAMTSDRPYREGMPINKVESILRNGADSQWDARVIEAFFEAQDEILHLAWKR